MATIRSHFISLFSGGVFPDRKWWLSCFCLPRGKEEKLVRQPPPTEGAIYTIQTSHDEEPSTEFKLLSGLERISVHEEASHRNSATASEAPLANGFKVHLMDSLSCNATVKTTEEDDLKASDVVLFSISEDVNTDADESSFCISLDASLSVDDALKAFENEESCTDIQYSAGKNDRDKVVPDVCNCTKGLAGEPSLASSIISCSSIFADFGERQSSRMKSTKEIRESEVEIVSEALSEINDDTKDGLKFITDLNSTCSSDHSFKISSNQETSGIQSNLSNLEDTSVHSSTFSGNETMMHTTSDEDSEPHCQSDNHIPLFHADCCSTESTSYDLLHTPIDSCHIGEIPGMSKCDDRQEMIRNNSALSQSCEMILSENVEKPFNEVLCNGITEKEILLDSRTHDATTQMILRCNNFDQQSYPFEVGSAESDALIKSKCDVTEDCIVSDQLLPHGMKNVMDTVWTVASDVSLTVQQSYNKADRTESVKTFIGTAGDRGNSVEMVQRSAAGNAESAVNQLRPDALTPNIEKAVMTDECSEFLDGSYRGVEDEEMAEFDDSMSLHTLLQMKLLFRPNSYETLERLVDSETVCLLGRALDEVFTVRRNRETLLSHGRKGLGDFCSEVTAEEIKTDNDILNGDELSSICHPDPFSLPKSNDFQEIVIENFEQLFDNEEWLDDDFGISSSIKDEFLRPPYCDRIQQATEAFHRHGFESEDDFLPPDLQLPVIQLMPETVFPLVDQATDIFWSRRRYGEPVTAVSPPETYFTVDGHSDNVDSCSQRSHETFVFHLVAEILQEIYSDELTEVPEPWQRVYNFKSKLTENPPTTVDLLKPLLHSRVLQWVNFEKGFPHEMTKKGTGLSKQLDKKDVVDRLLITEMYQEEPSWTDYSQDANMIRNRVTNKLFISLIDDTVQAFKFIQSSALTNKCQ